MPFANINPEQRLLLDLLSMASDPDKVTSEGVRWPDFLRVVRSLGLGPYLAQIHELRLSSLPDPVRDELRTLARANAILHLRRQQELVRIAGALEAEGIRLIVVKGMALVHLYYPTPTCRPMSDIDLLVQPQDLERTVAIARNLGFTASENALRTAKIRTKEQHGNCGLMSPDGAVQLEIHDSLWSMAQFGISAPGLWSRSVPATLGSARVSVLAPEDFLQHLCLHLGAHHGYTSRVHGLLDVALFSAANDNLDWEHLTSESRRTGASSWIYLTLWLAQELLQARVPRRFFQLNPAPMQLRELSELASIQLFFVSALPVGTNIVRLGSSRSLGALRSSIGALTTSFVDHWHASGLSEGSSTVRKRRVAWIRDYIGFAIHKITFFVRCGILKPSSWKGVSQYQASRSRFVELMKREEAHVRFDS